MIGWNLKVQNIYIYNFKKGNEGAAVSVSMLELQS